MLSPSASRTTRLCARATVLLALSLAACGGGASAAPHAPAAEPLAVPPMPPPASTSASRAEPADAPLAVTYVQIERAWVEEHMPANPTVPKAWSTDPANAPYILPTTRHVLVKSSATDPPAVRAAARKKATAILERLKRGEDFGKVARETSDDPGSKDKGGAYPGSSVEQFVEPYRAAYAALAPGQLTKQLVETQFGFHVIKKDPIDDAAIAAGFRHATALQMTRRLADDVADHLKPARAETSTTRLVDAAITTLLGRDAAGEATRPEVRILPLAKAPPAPADAICAQMIAIPRGTVSVLPLPNDGGFLVGKAGPERDADQNARDAAASEGGDVAWGRCSASGVGNSLSPAQLQQLMEQLQKAQKANGSTP